MLVCCCYCCLLLLVDASHILTQYVFLSIYFITTYDRSRATAYISRVLEALPVVGTAAPIAYAFSNPKIVENVVGPTGLGNLDLSFILASTTNNIVI